MPRRRPTAADAPGWLPLFILVISVALVAFHAGLLWHKSANWGTPGVTPANVLSELHPQPVSQHTRDMPAHALEEEDHTPPPLPQQQLTPHIPPMQATPTAPVPASGVVEALLTKLTASEPPPPTRAFNWPRDEGRLAIVMPLTYRPDDMYKAVRSIRQWAEPERGRPCVLDEAGTPSTSIDFYLYFNNNCGEDSDELMRAKQEYTLSNRNSTQVAALRAASGRVFRPARTKRDGCQGQNHAEVAAQVILRAFDGPEMKGVRQCFGNLGVFDASLPPDLDVYPMGPSEMFYRLVLEETSDPKALQRYEYVFLMESDVKPCREGWLNRLLWELPRTHGPSSQRPAEFGLPDDATKPLWVRGSMALMRSGFRDTFIDHLNGNAIYALHDEEFKKLVRRTQKSSASNPNLAYDVALQRTLRENPQYYVSHRHRYQPSDFIINTNFRRDVRSFQNGFKGIHFLHRNMSHHERPNTRSQWQQLLKGNVAPPSGA